MSSVYVLDTHALIWHIQDSDSLSSVARDVLARIDAGDAVGIISAITLVEMVYLTEKGRIPREPFDTLLDGLRLATENYRMVPIDLGVIRSLQQVPRDAIPDMPDRIIVATAHSLDVPLVSRDSAILAFDGVESIW